MTKPKPKTLDEHIDYHFEMARLMLWFAWRYVGKNDCPSLEIVLRDKTHIHRLAGFSRKAEGATVEEAYALPEWRRMLEPILDLYEQTKYDADALRFEDEGFVIFRDSLVKRARATFDSQPQKPNGELGALSYDPPKPNNPKRVIFHINNPLQPRSIFDDPEYLPLCLLALMDDAERKYGANELYTGTWLNSYPPFLENFPREYIDSLAQFEPFKSRGFGTWGQFMNARGCFNHKYANYFRSTGELPFHGRNAYCSFEALRQHLDFEKTIERR